MWRVGQIQRQVLSLTHCFRLAEVQTRQQSNGWFHSHVNKEQLDPFSLVVDELSLVTERLRTISMEYYLEKTYCKTASLLSDSCKSVAVLAGQPARVAVLAFEYGKNLGLAYQLTDDVLDFTGTSASLGKGPLSDIQHGIVTAPILYAMEEFPELRKVVDRGYDDPANVKESLKYLDKSQGVQRTRELAVHHATLAAAAIDLLPKSENEDVITSRLALIDLTRRAIARTK